MIHFTLEVTRRVPRAQPICFAHQQEMGLAEGMREKSFLNYHMKGKPCG